MKNYLTYLRQNITIQQLLSGYTPRKRNRLNKANRNILVVYEDCKNLA